MELNFSNFSILVGNKYIVKDINLVFNSNYISGVYQNYFLKEVFFNNRSYEGDILLNNRNIKKINKDVISYISCNNIFLTKTISDEFYLVKRHVEDDKEYVEKVISSLKMVGLSEQYLDREISTLSKSEKVLLTIALALIVNPEIIILDEVFKDLDNKYKLIIKRMIYELKKKYDKLIIILDNNMDILYDVCNYFMIFCDKKILVNNKKSIAFKDLDLLKEHNITLPKVIKFIDISKKYNINLSYYSDVNDIVKDVYRNVRKD